MFRVKAENIVNERGQVIEVQGGADKENQNIIVYTRNNKMSQRWSIEYADAAAPEPKEGELDKDFGLRVDKPFWIESQLGTKRYLDIEKDNDGASLVIRDRSGSNT